MIRVKFGLASLAAAALVACGGGGGAGGPQTLTGLVIDGYIENALVCLDLNNNLVCDVSEPQAKTDKEGRYTLEYSGSIAGVVVLAVVGVDATDSDLGKIEKPFNLFTPAERPEVITPLTTMVATEKITRGLTLDEAESSVRATLNMSSSQKVLGYDFVAANDAKTLEVAQIITASMAAVNDQLNATSLNPRQIALATVREVTTSVVPNVISSDGSSRIQVAANSSQADLLSQVESSTRVEGRIQQIVAGSAIDSKVVSIEQVFKDGFVVASNDSGDYIDENGQRVGFYSGYNNKLDVEYIVLNENKNEKPISSIRKVWLEEKSSWFHRFSHDDDKNSWIFINGKWESVPEADLLDRTDLRFDRNCMVVPFKPGADLAERFCITEKDVSGQLVSTYLKLADNVSPSTKFPSGSKGYDLTFSGDEDMYEIWGPSDNWTGYSFEGKSWEQPQNNKPTIALFISKLKKDNQWVGSNCNVGFKVKSFDEQAKTGVMQWAENPSKSCSGGGGNPDFMKAEETSFEITTVGGKELLVVNYANLYRVLNPGDGVAGKKIFGVVTNKLKIDGLSDETVDVQGIYSGEFFPKGTSVTFNFNGDTNLNIQLVNRTLFDAALEAAGIKAFDYLDFYEKK
jgi:hypothetical protein